MGTLLSQIADALRGRALLRGGLLLSGLTLLTIASAFLLVDPWGGSSPRGVAASAEFEAGPDPSSNSIAQVSAKLEVGEAIARVESDDLSAGVLKLAAALLPTATATPRPTATVLPTAAPQPTIAAAPPPSLPSAPLAPTSQPASCPIAGMGGYALALFNAINAERTQQGLAALGADGCAVFVGQARSDDMANLGYFAHTSPSGATAFSLLDAYGVPHGWAGENLARNNYPDAEAVGVAIRDLMASQGHRDNILNVNYTHLGVGLAIDGGGMKYFAMIFIGPP